MRTMLVAAAVALGWSCGSPASGSDGGGCGSTLTPPNLVDNGGFECGGDAPTQWQSMYGDLAFVADAHTGTRAARVTASSNGSGQFAFASVVANPSTPKTYCAAAWMKGTTPNAILSVMVDTGGGGTDYSFTSPITAAWIRLPPSTNLKVPTPAGAKVYVRVIEKDATAGQQLLVDDVDVWESADGRCQETR